MQPLTKRLIAGQSAPGVVLAAAVLLGAGCSDADIFTQGRIETLCEGAVPICRAQAGCVLDAEHFTQGAFPGEQRLVVRSEARDAVLRVRLLFLEMIYPGSELLLQAHSPDCADADLHHQVDVDLFELAGEDRVYEVELALPEAGDHLLDVYSDMTADYLLTVDVEEGI